MKMPQVSWYVCVSGFFCEVRDTHGRQLSNLRGGNVALGSEQAADPDKGVGDAILGLWALQTARLLALTHGADIVHDLDTQDDCVGARAELFGSPEASGTLYF